MKRAGEVVGVAQGLAVVRCGDDSHAAIGTKLLEDDLSTAGEVVDVFGPVDRPFLAVNPTNPPAALLGTRLYSE